MVLGVGTGLLLAGLPVAYLTWPAPVPGVSDGAEVGGRFELVDPQGRRVDERTFAGQWTLVFFGFTHCPDVCPTTLATVSRVMGELGDNAERVQPLFITLDPERDTPAVMGAYTAFFDPRIMGLTGSPAQIRQASDAYGVYAKRVPHGGSYLLDHSTRVYLMRPDGTLAQAFSQEGADAMTRQIRAQLDAERERS